MIFLIPTFAVETHVGGRGKFIVLMSALAIVAFLCTSAVSAPPRPDRQEKRARPPKWSANVLDAFFEDARTKLVGVRPDYAAATIAHTDNKVQAAPANEAAPADSAAWSKLIDAETLETEIKRLAQFVGKGVTTPSDFKGGAYEFCRRDFSVLAVLFAVVGDYDADVRWKDSAPALRDVFSRAGYNCKVGTDQTYQESMKRKQDLADLVGGSRPQLPKVERTPNWGQVADRPPLMQRLSIAHEERLTKWLANEREFKQHRNDVRHEAQLVALLADVIGREGFDYWDEENYAKPARELRQAASDVAAAVELENYQQARQGIDRATKACAACHELYRG